jgi:glycosyltransferase involved in cell wall biosynthesis
MNILVFTTAFYPSIGGLEKHTGYLVREFINSGNKVKVITFQEPPFPEQVVQLKEQGVEVCYNPVFLKVALSFLWCDVLYMPNFSIKGSWFLLFLPFKKWVISHNDSYLSNRKSTKIKIKRLLVNLATKNISVSNHVATNINTRSKIIYNCFDNEIFKLYHDEERKYEFVFLGRLVSQKGCELLIKACRSLNYPFTLNIIGEGPEKGRLETLVINLKLEKSIHFLGILSDELLARALNRHQVLVIPSIGEEGFGIVALEGMACGCKIIAANAGGLPEAVNGFGKLFEMGNQEDLEYLLNIELKELNVTIRNQPSEEIKEYLASHSKQTVAAKYFEVF